MTKLIAAINVTLDGFCDHTAMIADEDDEGALATAHVGERIGLAVHAFELEVARPPAEVADACRA